VNTLLTRSPGAAADIIKRGGTVAFPTETVYGLGADIFNEDAIRKIFEAKQRPTDNPLIAHIADARDVALLTNSVSPAAAQLINAFFPGPLTIVVAKVAAVPPLATAGLETIGIRMPSHPIAREFLQACGTPVVAPSANLSGRPSPTTWQTVYEDLDGRIDCILKGDPTEIGIESSVVDCSGDIPVILRRGAISVERIREVVPETVEYQPGTAGDRRSPGMRHKHYTPRAQVLIAEPGMELVGSKMDAFIGLTRPLNDLKLVRVCGTVDEYASSVFEFFRECDRARIERIFCETVDEKDIGAALMDRIHRAAER